MNTILKLKGAAFDKIIISLLIFELKFPLRLLQMQNIYFKINMIYIVNLNVSKNREKLEIMALFQTLID